MTSKFLPHVQIICLRVRVIYPVPPLVLTSNTFKKGQIASRRDTWWCQWQGTKLDRRNHNKSCYWASPTVALTNSWKMNVLPAPEARPKRATAMMGMAVMNILSSSTEKLLTDLTPSPPSPPQYVVITGRRMWEKPSVWNSASWSIMKIHVAMGGELEVNH